MQGRGMVAIWSDVAPAARNAFYAWHGGEHIAERVAVPGFLRARRYVAEAGAPEFFLIYEAENFAALTSAAYRARLDAPTQATRAMGPSLLRVERAVGTVVRSAGTAQGGLLAAWRGSATEGVADAVAGWAAQPGVAAAHLMLADLGASAASSAERRARRDADRAPEMVALLEGWGDAAPFTAQARTLFAAAGLDGAGFGLYRLQVALGA